MHAIGAIIIAAFITAGAPCAAPEDCLSLNGYMAVEEAVEYAEIPEYVGIEEAENAEPYWIDSEVHRESAECGACGAELTEYRMVLSYDGTEWVAVCDSCFELFASEEPEHRAIGEECAKEHEGR